MWEAPTPSETEAGETLIEKSDPAVTLTVRLAVDHPAAVALSVGVPAVVSS